jgi:SM-20-related protein
LTQLASLKVNPAIDVAAARETYRAHGRVRISSVLKAGAPELYGYLLDSDDWIQLVNHETGAHELPLGKWNARGSATRRKLEQELYERARDGFQYSYAALRVPQAGEDGKDPVLDAVAELMRSPAMIAMLEAVTGVSDPQFVDGQVTSYGPGDFLTGHDDDVTGSRRKAAFVYGVTPQWRPEWGGLLLFHEHGEVEISGMVPQFNTLDLFAVPRFHSVSQVTPAAPRRRYSVTGWLAAP